ncbi:Retrovirus-related Pol polyprotein from transposon TNT 1-94 [Trichinella pseudospiralis]|uniref:Retrovirus-related Pol polyprotein from transposon TNT 1-94 n=1 Tax=Trichinella pseudospiralis TaxID=6337 RepID=A0A0V1ISJ3_TRIPS|nr:Retrovirus-related Pol polyprotein from transposon TNT 1-94 [Trichinella pseudospiralis]
MVKMLHPVMVEFYLRMLKLKMVRMAPFNEHCIYYLWKNKNFLALGVYVDDLLILSNSESLNNELKTAFHWCLGIRIVQDVENGTLSFAQEQYIEETLHQFRMSDCKGVKTPFYTIQVLSKVIMPRSDDEIKKMHAVPYRVAVGCLLSTRYSLEIVSCFSDNPGKAHWTAVKLGVQALTVYSDADWGNDRDDRRYISGCCAPLWCSDCMTINKATHGSVINNGS